MTLISLSLYLFADQRRLDLSDILPSFVILGAGIGLTMSPMSTAAMNAVPKTGRYRLGVLSMFRMVWRNFRRGGARSPFQSGSKDPAGEHPRRRERSDRQSAFGLRPSADRWAPTSKGFRGQGRASVAAGHDAFIYGLSNAMTLSVRDRDRPVLVAFFLIGNQAESMDEGKREAGEVAEAVNPWPDPAISLQFADWPPNRGASLTGSDRYPVPSPDSAFRQRSPDLRDCRLHAGWRHRQSSQWYNAVPTGGPPGRRSDQAQRAFMPIARP